MENNQEEICVSIRMRPLNEREQQSGQYPVFQCQSIQNSVTATTREGQSLGDTYYYDHVFDENSNNSEVYQISAKEIVKGVTRGMNGTIFAYGQTSSGKTHTMLGSGESKGVLELATEDIFSHVTENPNRDFIIRVSFVEIYNEIIRDLLSDAADPSVSIREDPRRGIYCEAVEVMISDEQSIIRLLKKGIAKRTVESTAMNDKSSRSHTIFKIVIESKESSREVADPDGAVLVATLNLVDLAGSESVKHTGASGQRAKEGGKINQSLLSLSRVIHALSQPGAHVNFRDSKLTRLLQPSLSGNAKMSVVCCITPAERYLEETRSTLQFASRAKLVKTNAKVNEVLDDSTQLRRLRKELEELREIHCKNLIESNQEARCPTMDATASQLLEKLESEKRQLQVQLKVVVTENEEYKVEMERLRSLHHAANDVSSDLSGVLSAQETSEEGRNGVEIKPSADINKKRSRATWCPNTTDRASEPEEALSKRLPQSMKKQRDRMSFLPQDFANIVPYLNEPGSMDGSFLSSDSGDRNHEAIKESQMTLTNLKNENKTLLNQIEELLFALEEKSIELDVKKAKQSEIEVKKGVKVDASNLTKDEEINELKKEIERLNAINSQEVHLDFTNIYQTQQSDELVDPIDAQLKLKEAEIQNLKNSLESSISALRSEEGEREKLCRQHKEEMETLTAALEDLKGVVDSQNKAMLELVSEANEANLARDAALTQLDKRKMQAVDTWDKERDEATNRVISITVERDDAARSRDELISQLDELKSGNDRLTTERDEALRSRDEMTYRLDTLTAERDEALISCEELTRQMEGLAANRDEANVKEFDELKTQRNDALSQMDDLMAEKEEAIRSRDMLTNHVAGLTAERDEAMRVHDELTSRLDGLTVERDEVSRTCDELGIQLQESFSQLDSLKTGNNRLTTEKDEALRSRDDLKCRLDTLTAERDEATENHIDELKTKLKAVLNQIEDLITEKDEATNCRDMLTNQVDELTKQMNGLTTDIDEANRIHEVLMDELKLNIDNLSKERDEVQRAFDEMVGRLSEMTAERDEAVRSCNEMSHRIENLTADGDEATKYHIDELKTQLNEAFTQMDVLLVEKEESFKGQDALTNQIEELKAERDEASRSLHDLKGQMSGLQSNLEELANERTEILKCLREMEAQMIALTAERDEAVRKCDEMTSQMEGLIADGDEATTNHIDELKSQLIAEKEVNSRSQDEFARHMDALTAERDEAIRSYDVLTSQMARLQCSLDGLTAEKDEAIRNCDDVVGQMVEIKHQLNESSCQVCVLVVERDEAVRSRNELTYRLDSLTAARDEATSSQHDELKIQLQETLSQMDKLVEEKEEAIQCQDMLKTQVDELTRLMVGLQSDIDSLTISRDESTRSLDRLEAHINAVRAEKDEAIKNCDEFVAQIDWLKSQQSEYISQIDVLTVERDAATSSQHDELKIQLKEALSQMDVLIAEKEEATRSQDLLTNQVYEMTKQLVRLTLDRDEANRIHEELESRLDAMTAERDESSRNHDEIVSQMVGLQSQLNEFSSEIVELTEARDEAIETLESKSETIFGLLKDYNNAVVIRDESLNELNDLKMKHYEALNRLSSLKEELDSVLKMHEEVIQERDSALLERNLLQEQVEVATANVIRLNNALEVLQLNGSEEKETQIQSLMSQVSELTNELIEADRQMEATEKVIENLNERIVNQDSEAMDRYEILESNLNKQLKDLQRISTMEQEAMQNDMQSLQNTCYELNEEKRNAMQTIEELHSNLQFMQSHSDELKMELEELKKMDVVKNERMAHLETCKLTKDQMEKIKVMTEERKKYQEDAKTLKKQLHSLKKLYDGVTASKNNHGSVGPPSEFVISDLKFQQVDLLNQLEQSKEMIATLKEKLRECSKQLQEYEKERQGVIELLERNGIDTIGLIPSDQSVMSEEASSIVEQDLSEAITKLMNKISGSSGHSKVDQKVQIDLEECRRELMDITNQKSALEKRLESLKTSAKTSREETANLTVQLETLQRQLMEAKENQHALLSKNDMASGSSSSEIQALEEENIELMKELKQSQLEISRLRMNGSNTVVAVHNSEVKSLPSSSETVLMNKRVFGTDKSNVMATTSNGSVESSIVNKLEAKAIKSVLTKDASESENVPPLNGKGLECKNGLCSIVNVHQPTATVKQSLDDVPGECNQN